MLSVRRQVNYPTQVVRPLLAFAVAWLAAAGCAPKTARIPGPLAAIGGTGARAVAVERERRERAPQKTAAGGSIAEAARHYLEVSPRGYRDDCSGYVEAVFARAGFDLRGSTAMFYELAEEQGALHHHKLPRPGDLAFFDDTYDRNHNGQLDDPLSHVAVVLEVAADGTILLGHGGTSRGRTTLTMNLEQPDLREADDGHVLNDWLRVRRDGDPARTRYLAGELWRAFATLDGRELAVAIRGPSGATSEDRDGVVSAGGDGR